MTVSVLMQAPIDYDTDPTIAGKIGPAKEVRIQVLDDDGDGVVAIVHEETLTRGEREDERTWVGRCMTRKRFFINGGTA